jgi:hypothetical protein
VGGYDADDAGQGRDGKRFLMIKEGVGAGQTAAAPKIIVVQHFDEELKRLVPTK